MEWTNVWNNNLVEYYSIAEEKLRKKYCMATLGTVGFIHLFSSVSSSH
jgi:hypothetical protein